MKFDEQMDPSDMPDFNDELWVSSANPDEVYRWVQQLSSCQVPIANRTSDEGLPHEGLLNHKLRTLAEEGYTFALAFHKGGKYNSMACTSVICEQCGAKLYIEHPGSIMRDVTLAASYVTPFVTHYIAGITQV
jgi:hypothetical protein